MDYSKWLSTYHYVEQNGEVDREAMWNNCSGPVYVEMGPSDQEDCRNEWKLKHDLAWHQVELIETGQDAWTAAGFKEMKLKIWSGRAKALAAMLELL